MNIPANEIKHKIRPPKIPSNNCCLGESVFDTVVSSKADFLKSLALSLIRQIFESLANFRPSPWLMAHSPFTSMQPYLNLTFFYESTKFMQ